MALSEVSELRIVLLGKSSSEISRVGNFILNRDAFDTEAPPPSVEQHSERARGNVEGRYITLINTPHLFDPQLRVTQLTHRVRECMSLCAPGPHVIVLVIQPDDFTETDRHRLNHILRSLSEETRKYTMVLTTQVLQSGTRVDPVEENVSQKIIRECSNRHVDFSAECSHSYILEMMHKMIEENGRSHLKWDEYETLAANYEFKPKEKLSQRLNLVLCGSDGAMKASISDLILGQREPSPESSSVCVRREGEVCGRLVTLVEMPALYNTQLSEEEVMQETLHCVSLCDPGVHAFLLIIPEGRLTDEDKGEMEKIQTIFGSKVNDHLIALFTTVCSTVIEIIEHNPETKHLIAICRQRYRIMETKEGKNLKQVPEMLDEIARMEAKPYCIHMYVKAQKKRIQHELEDKHKEELSKMEKKIQELKKKVLSEGDEDPQGSECLRIVLIGKTGSGKSATGNTILGRDEFVSEASMDSVTNVCKKGVGEVLGKSVTVVDTPGLFDTTLSNEAVIEELVKCISMSAPGPHAFIIVLSLGRITREELDTLDLIKKIFGPNAANFSIVLFTRGDDLGNQSIRQYIEKGKNEQMKKLLRDCGNRYLAFNNTEKNDRSQVSELLRQIEMVINSNKGQHFTNNMFQEAEMSIRKKMEEIMKEREKEIEAEKEKLEARYISEMEDIKKRLEEEKQKAEEEKQQIERKFREKTEALQKEFEEKNEAEKRKREMEDKARLEDEKKQMEQWHQRINELEIENKKQRAEFEKQLKDRENEDKKREERYKQDRENLIKEQKYVIEELRKRQKEDLQRRALDECRRRKEEEDERRSWERKIKEAEHDRKEIQEDLKRKQRKWEAEQKRQMKEREEEEHLRKQRHEEELRAKQEEQERMRKKFEKQGEEERRRRDTEKEQWREAERKESERKEREYEEKKHAVEAEMKEQYEKLERMRKEEWERRKREDDKRTEEERQRLQKLREEIERQRQEEREKRESDEKARREREEKQREEMKMYFDHKMKEMMDKYEADARIKGEMFNEFKDKKEKHIQELLEKLKKYKSETDNYDGWCVIL